MRLFVLMVSLLSLTAFAQRFASPANTTEHFMNIGSVQRRYLVHLPPHFNKSGNAPLVLLLHGGRGRPETAAHDGQIDATDAHGFVLVMPEGINGGWNDGRIVKGHGNDDVAFLSALIDTMVHDYGVDAKRVYSTGISNGGFMSFRLACDLSDKIAAIAPVAASMGEGAPGDCHPSHPIPVLMINGTKDPLIPFNGGEVGGTLLRNRGTSAPVPKVVEFWRKQADCTSTIEKTDLPDRDKTDDSTVTREACQSKSGAEVINYTVIGGGHTWPGGTAYAPKAVVGVVNRDFNASAVIFDFFSRH